MNYDEFAGQVQARAGMASKREAAAAIRATLMTLAERLYGRGADDLASRLPAELGWYMRQMKNREAFGMDEFFRRAAEREGADLAEAVFHARVVMEVLGEAVSRGEMEEVRAQLPEEYKKLFEKPVRASQP